MSKVINVSKSIPILCQYKNPTECLQTIRLLNSPFNGLERMIYPGKTVEFKALPEAYLEVLDHGNITTLLDKRISCKKLEILENKLDYFAA